jgi:hypothetical protein
VSGWGFFYALRYFYDDQAAGIIPTDSLWAHNWEIRDDGVEITPAFEAVEARHSFHRWDEIIVIAKDTYGRAVILDRLPPELYAPERARLYDPYARIEPGFVPARVREILPPIQYPAQRIVP